MITAVSVELQRKIKSKIYLIFWYKQSPFGYSVKKASFVAGFYVNFKSWSDIALRRYDNVTSYIKPESWGHTYDLQNEYSDDKFHNAKC